jgi:fucose permease
MTESHDHFEGRSQVVFVVTIAVLLLATVFVSLRMVSRAVIVKKIAIDDYLIVVAWAIALGLSISICFGCRYGLGRHESDIPQSWQSTLLKSQYAFEVMYQPALMATKTSILAFYLSLPTSNKIFKWACVGTLAVVLSGGLAMNLFTIFQCRPVGAAFAYPTPSTAHCTDIITIYMSSTPLNLTTDLTLLLLPMPVLTGMRLPKKQKIILIITFSFGIFAAAVDVVRIAYLQSAATTRLDEVEHDRMSQHGSTRTAEQTDLSWYSSFSFMWSVVEVNIAIVCACVPGLKPLVSRFMPNLLRSAGDMSSKSGDMFSKSGDLTSKRGSVSDPTQQLSMTEAHNSLQVPENVFRHDFNSPEDSVDTNQIGLMDFLSVPAAANTTPPEIVQTPGDGQLGFMDFLTTPETQEIVSSKRPSAARPSAARPKQQKHSWLGQPTFFDFVNMEKKKSMVQMTNKESIYPVAMVTVLFFIWGFEYGLITALNQQFQGVIRLSFTQSTAIHSAYFIGYFFGPLLIANPVLKHWGYKACYPIGLCIYACGTLVFWPAGVLESFPAFLITNFIVGLGLSVLEAAANPFIVLCGPAEYGEIRLNISQSVQALGNVVAPLLADKVLFRKTSTASSLVNTQWVYLGLSLFTVFLAVVYYYVPLPEATDQELEDAAFRADGANDATIGGIRIIWITLTMGVCSTFFYYGGQEVNATNFDLYLKAVAPSYDPTTWIAIAYTAFAASRFLAAAVSFYIQPRVILLAFFLGSILFEVLAMHTTGKAGVAMIIMVFFMEGPLFASLYAQALRGMGRHTKKAGIFVTSAAAGGAVFSPIATILSTKQHHPRYALVTATAAFAAGTVFPIFVNASPLARKQADPPKRQSPRSESKTHLLSRRKSSILSFFRTGRQPSGRSCSSSSSTEEKKDGL